MTKLVMTLDGNVVKEIALEKDSMSIGRRPENDVQVNDLAVSGRHALISVMNNTYVEDLGSTNGTLVNGKKVKKAILKHGDLIQIGSHQFSYLSQPETAYEPTMFLKAEFEPTMMLDAKRGKQLIGDTRGGPLGAIKILDGPMAGKIMELRKPFSTLGINGVKVALISRHPNGYSIHCIKSRTLRRAVDTPILNGEIFESEDRMLNGGDIIEIAGTSMRFIRM